VIIISSIYQILHCLQMYIHL